MKDFRLPGIVHVIVIALAIIGIETYTPVEYQAYAELAVVAIFGIAKANKLGTQQIEELLTILRQVQMRPTPPQASGPGGFTEAARAPSPTINTKRYEPNKIARWLIG